MASVFKRKRDKARRGSYWYFSYQDERGRRKTKRGFTDKKATEELANETERQVRLRKEGLVDPDIELKKKSLVAPIADHLDAFESSLAMNTGKHVKLTMSRVRRLVAEAEFKTIKDIEIDSIEAVLHEMLDANEIGHRTYNHYVQAFHQFCTWLVPKKLASNPIAGMKRLNTAVDVRRPRVALTEEEFRQLIESARKSDKDIQCFDGEQRARIYTLSYMTGLRRGELASLTPRSFDLESETATLTVEATASKHRRKDVLPLHPGLVVLLREWLKGIKRSEPIFPKLAKRRTWLMVKKDLERVGIAYKTDEGYRDFHASGRHTHITQLLRNGASVPEAMQLARHSDVRTTMKYTHIGLKDQAKAVSKLPWKTSSGEEEPGSGDDEPAQRSDSGTGLTTCHSADTPGTPMHANAEGDDSQNPRELALVGGSEQGLSPQGIDYRKQHESGSIPAASISIATCEFLQVAIFMGHTILGG